jgi:hypothetical protein
MLVELASEVSVKPGFTVRLLRTRAYMCSPHTTGSSRLDASNHSTGGAPPNACSPLGAGWR